MKAGLQVPAGRVPMIFRRALTLTGAVILTLFVLPAQAADSVTIEEVQQQLKWKTFEADISFTVQRSGGSPMTKEMTVSLRQDGNKQKMFAIFTYPANMQGTAFLALTSPDRDDEYYLYLRTLRRVKRVPSSTENFMLRDFLSLYFLKPRPEFWKFSPLSTMFDGAKEVVKLQGKAVDAKTESLTGYHRIVHFVDPAAKVIERTEFFDKKGKLVRVQIVDEFVKVKDSTIASRFKTEDYVEGVSATIEILELRIDEDVPEDIFTVRHLKKL
jgi:hypothetical protein